MNLEERVAQAVVTKAQAVAPPIVDIDDIRRRGRRQARRRTAVSVAAVAVLVGGTIWGASTLSDLDQSSEPTNQTPSNPDSLRPLTYAEDGTIHYGDKTIEVGPELNGLTVTDYGVAFTTQDGRIWFSDGDSPKQIGVTNSDVLERWGFTQDGYAFKEPDWVVAGSTGAYAEWFEFPAPGKTEIAVYDTREAEIVDRVPIDVPQDCKTTCAQLQGVYDGRLYWTEEPCRPFAMPAGVECEGNVAPPHVHDLASGTETTMTMAEYADELRARPRMIGVRGAPEEGGRDVPLNLSDGTGLADARSNVIFANGGSGNLDGMSPGGLGEVRYDVATDAQLRFDRPAGFDRNANFAFVGWLDDESFQLAELRFGKASTPQIGALLVCGVGSGTCDVASPAPDSASTQRIVPNF